jgi:hypothetical protein
MAFKTIPWSGESVKRGETTLTYFYEFSNVMHVRQGEVKHSARSVSSQLVS